MYNSGLRCSAGFEKETDVDGNASGSRSESCDWGPLSTYNVGVSIWHMVALAELRSSIGGSTSHPSSDSRSYLLRRTYCSPDRC